MSRRSEEARALGGGEDEEIQYLVRFGLRIREQRKVKKLSQEDLALFTGLDRSYVSAVERGLRNVSLLNLRLIAKGLDISPALLIDGV
jgi:transcriptional regulator with XRE-family HTH domain